VEERSFGLAAGVFVTVFPCGFDWVGYGLEIWMVKGTASMDRVVTSSRNGRVKVKVVVLTLPDGSAHSNKCGRSARMASTCVNFI
jgi:hypothetical protein